ncbi:MAG TPA: hypothetical protein VJH67_00040 [Candidatus Paceibacterota bacterium]
MKKSKRTKILSILLIVVALSGLPMISKNLKTDEAVDSQFVESPELQEITDVLLEMQSVSLDTTLLQSPEFSYLSDSTLSLPALPIGRENPFSAF